MTRGRYNRSRNASGSKSPRRSLALHPLFGFVLGLWGAALGGLVTLVMPRNLVLEAAATAGLAGIGANAPFVLAAVIWNVASGLIARLVPRLQIYFVALPGQILGGFLMLAALSGAILAAWEGTARSLFTALPGTG